MIRLLTLFVLLIPIIVTAAPLPPVPSRPTRNIPIPPESTNRIVLVKPKATTMTSQMGALRSSLNLKDETNTKRLKWKQFSIPPGQDKHETIAKLKASGLFEHVQEPKIYKTQETIPNDPMFPQLWGMANISAPLAWDRIKEAPNIVVAVVDTGIDFTHPDLAANLWTGPNGEHGYVATNGVVIAGGQDDHGHGTHVAGTIGGVGNNAIGVAGIAWKTKIMAMKVLHSGSGSDIDIVNGYEKLVDIKESGIPVLVSNHSYGGRGEDPFMEDGFKLLADADIFCAVAAGNDGMNIDLDSFFPASFSFDNMVVAMAIDSNSKKASFSNYGLIGVDIAAPGVAIWSTTPGNTYSAFSGTSMASPHVAGVATILRQLNRNLTASQVKEVMLNQGSYDAGNYQSSTSGKLNLARAVNNPKVFDQPFVTNHPPKIDTLTQYTLISNTQPVILRATGSDPDGDTLKWQTIMNGLSSLFERRLLSLSGFFVTNIDNLTIVAGGTYAYQLASEVLVGVSDQRGGSDQKVSGFEFVAAPGLRKAIAVKTWTVTTNAASSNQVTITFDVLDDAKTNYIYEILMTFPDSNIVSFGGNHPSPVPYTINLGRLSSAFNMRAFVMDKWLNHLTTDRITYPSNSTTFPTCVTTVSTNEGNAPFDVVFDLRGSARAKSYAVLDVFTGSTFVSGPTQAIPFTAPGLYFKMPLVWGNVPGEIDLDVIPIFASRFLGTNPISPPTLVNVAVQKSSTTTGPWTAFTNFTDSTAGPQQFYRLEISK